MTAEHDEEPAAGRAENLLAAGKALIEEAQATLAEIDAAMNTAVLPIIKLPVDGKAAPATE